MITRLLFPCVYGVLSKKQIENEGVKFMHFYFGFLLLLCNRVACTRACRPDYLSVCVCLDVCFPFLLL